MWSRACAIAMVVVGAAAPAARADGVCVRIDPDRDSLGPGERSAVRIAIEAALEKEGVVVDRGSPGGGGCAPGAAALTAFAIKLGEAVTVTILHRDGKVSGRAANLDEVDLLVSQLVRSLVTGRSLATGSGVTDRYNVLRAQAAPRRAAPSSRRWIPTVAVGGGMLQLPATDERARQRQYDVIALESRWWGYPADSDRGALELFGRAVLHDYAVIGAADDAYDRSRDSQSGSEGGRLMGLFFSPLAVASYEAGLGVVTFAGDGAPRPYVRLGATVSLLLRLSDPDHYADVGLGGYAGVGFDLTSRVGLSVTASVANPVVHNFLDEGYWYFFTTTALLEIRGAPRERRLPAFLRAAEPPVIRRIND